MKKILFVLTECNTGGIVSSLRNLLLKIDREKYQIEIFFLIENPSQIGTLPNCSILNVSSTLDSLLCHLPKKKGLAKLHAILLKSIDKLSGRRMQKHLFTKIGSRLLKKQYDSVIAFSEGLPTFFVSCLKHENKTAWIHCNYESYHRLNDNVDELAYYDSFRYIVNVSKYTQGCFLDIYPTLHNKCLYIYNILNEDYIKERSFEATLDMTRSEFDIVSVGRIDPVKRFRIIPQIAKKVKDAGCHFKWYIIGPQGNLPAEYTSLINNIKEYGVEDIVTLLGEQSNPYKYISKSSLLVCTSESEACPYVINEAKILGTPVVCTNFGSAHEFVLDGENGFVSPVENIPQIVTSLIKDKVLYDKIKSKVANFKYDNENILTLIYSLI